MVDTNYKIQLPPEGTGKRTHAHLYTLLGYQSGTVDFVSGDTVTGATSGATGDVVSIDGTTASGNLYIERNAFGAVPDFTSGEDLDVNGTTKAVASDAGTPYYQPTTFLVGGNQITNAQFVDKSGAAYIRFQEGPQLLDAFGTTKVSQASLIGDYSLEYGDDGYIYQNVLTSVGSEEIEEDLDENSITLRVGNASGERITRTTHKYHVYTPSYPQLSLMSVQLSDTKDDVERNWGYFDAYNGFMFRQDGSTLSVVIRNSSSGTTQETVINQSSFNTDRVDGSGGLNNLSDVTLDVTKLNLYFIDLLWVGPGRIRFGVIADGKRIIMHDFVSTNESPAPPTATAALPLRWEIENKAITSGTSEIKNISAAVLSEGVNVSDKGRLAKSFQVFGTDVGSGDIIDGYESAIFGFRAAITDIKGNINRKAIIPFVSESFLSDSPIILRVYKSPENAGGTWNRIPDTLIEANTGITSFSGGVQISSTILPIGSKTADLTNTFSYLSEYAKIFADASGSDEYILTGQKIGDGPDATLNILAFSWHEFA